MLPAHAVSSRSIIRGTREKGFVVLITRTFVSFIVVAHVLSITIIRKLGK